MQITSNDKIAFGNIAEGKLYYLVILILQIRVEDFGAENTLPILAFLYIK